MRHLCFLIGMMLGETCLFAWNAFTIHESPYSPVNIYYDTELLDSHILLSLYKSAEYGDEEEMQEWIADGLPICGPFLTVFCEADNNTFCVTIGTGNETIIGYIKRGTVSVLTRTNGDSFSLFNAPYCRDKVVYTSEESLYVQILGKKGDWFYVRLIGAEDDNIRGWLPPEMQCPNYLATCE